MKEEFKYDIKFLIFRFIRFYIDFTDDLDQIINSVNSKGKIIILRKKNLELNFEKKGNKIIVSFDKGTFEIDSIPITFQNENNDCLFKIYHFPDLKKMENIFESINKDYDFYLPNNHIISFEEIKKGYNKLIILKKKINQFNDIFKLLCKRLSKEGKSLTIKTNNLLPENSVSLSINLNSEFQLIIDSRKSLINKIENFIKDKNKYILKIYAVYGIGISTTLLYFMSIETEYRMIYFNLKDIFNNGGNPFKYFQNALMKYYSTNNCNFDTIENKKENEENEKDKFNYELYLKDLQDLKTNTDLRLKNNFWYLLNYFCTIIKYSANSIIIIDQYKRDYDKEGSINLNILLSEFGENGFIKFIVASSLKDDSVKEDFRDDLRIISENIIDKISLMKEHNENENNEIEDELFKDFEFEQKNDEMNYEDDFAKISFFKIDNDDKLENINFNNTQEKNNNNKINQENRSEMLNNFFNTGVKIFDQYEIIYVNNLISIEELINDPKDKEMLRLFNFNPKTYKKYNDIFLNYPSSLSEDRYKLFLDSRFEEIEGKIDLFYRKLENMKKYSNYTPESLKSIFLVKLYEIIKTKKALNLKELIQYLEVFPFQYLKIYSAENNTDKKGNIIYLNKYWKDRFILEYSNEFVEIAFSKILYSIPFANLIDIKDLIGSAIDPLVENRIKRNLKKNGFIIKYFRNFSSNSGSITTNENEENYICDYNTYKKFQISYDDENVENLHMDYNKYYYIIPGNQPNRILDSIILKLSNNNSFDMIFFQINKLKIVIKKKSQYIKYCFLAKKKFESVYGIKINKLYFYFILVKDFDNQKTKVDLKSKNIEFFYYSILEDGFFKKDGILRLNNLNEPEAEIFENTQEDEYQHFNSKLTLINYLEKYLQKKRTLDKNFIITKNKFELGRKHLIKSANIILDEENKKQIDNILKIHLFKHDSELIYKYIFNIIPLEFAYFSNKENIFGIMIHYDDKIPTKKAYKYFYNGHIFPVGFLPTIFFNDNYCNLKNNLPKDKEYLISEIPEQYWDKIYVFRIYGLLSK